MQVSNRIGKKTAKDDTRGTWYQWVIQLILPTQYTCHIITNKRSKNPLFKSYLQFIHFLSVLKEMKQVNKYEYQE
jgi:hypothetical protein